MPAIGNVQTVPRLLAWRRGHEPQRVALEVDGVDSLTFAQWDSSSDIAASALIERGLRPGDRVCLVFGGRDWTHYAIAYCAVQKAGGVAVPLSDRLPQAQIDQLANACAAKMVIRGSADTEVLLASPSPVALPEPAPDDLAQILFTSGTTGTPKAVGATHANLTLGAPTHPKRLALAHSQRFLHAFPIGSNAAQTMLLNCLTARPSAVTLPRFTPVRFARLLQTGQVGTVFLVPAMAIELLNSGVLPGRDLTGVHLVGSTAAPLPAAIALRLTQAFPKAAVVNYYTSTEAAPAQTSMIFDPARPDAVGRPAPGSILITDADGAPAPPGVIGDVWLRSPHPRRYLGDEAATASTFRGDWVRMGDVGRLADGYLYLSDRDSDIVKSGAHKVSTLEVEAAIYEHPAVADAAVVGLPHPVLGKQLAAVVVARSPIGLPALRAFLAQRLADHQLPAQLLVLESLPRNESGKVSKRELAARFPIDAGRQA
ncbi:acyl-CoA synthetase [Rhizocola hellebori]|uniref:Acyl-CoA synthetase n=1 Tax=Rhizocola hellebori TaxID=1392758 RepID=A0A8J3QJS7_9ACTN|nr:AMP-binding protein [Rhizocola hellebori]GIH11030.1 acyl-CoA synthetase [Rhizocola hellebori]